MDELMPDNEVLDPREVQDAHRRLLAAKEEGTEPRAEDVALAERVNSSPFAGFDRAWRAD